MPGTLPFSLSFLVLLIFSDGVCPRGEGGHILPRGSCKSHGKDAECPSQET